MNNIISYERFSLNEKIDWYERAKLSRSYQDRAREYGLPADATVMARTENFFQKIEDRINYMATSAAQLQDQRRSERPPSEFGTGIESTYGLVSVVPSVLKRIFAPTEASYDNKWKGAQYDNMNDDEVGVDFLRHTNNEFIAKELPSIQTEEQLQKNIEELYKKGQVKPGEVPAVDDIAKNRINTFYSVNK